MKFYLLMVFLVSSLFSQQYPERIPHPNSNFPYPKSEISGPVQSRQPNEYHSQYPPGEEWRQFPQAKQVTGNDATWEKQLTSQSSFSWNYDSDYICDTLSNTYHIIEFEDPDIGKNIVVIKYGSDGSKIWEKKVKNTVSYDQLFRFNEIQITNDQYFHLVYSTRKPDNSWSINRLKYDPDGNMVYDKEIVSLDQMYSRGSTKNETSYINKEGFFYFLYSDIPGEKWIIEKYDEDNSQLFTYDSEALSSNYYYQDILTNSDDRPVVKLASDSQLKFYQFDDSLKLEWSYTHTIESDYFSNSEIIEMATVFDGYNNLFFYDRPISSTRMIRIDSTGQKAGEFQVPDFGQKYSAGVNSNNDIYVIIPIHGAIYVCIYDTSGNLLEEHSYEYFLFEYIVHPTTGDNTGQMAINKYIFNEFGQLSLASAGDAKYSENRLISETNNQHLHYYDQHFVELWQTSWMPPSLNYVGVFRSYVDDQGYSYIISYPTYIGGVHINKFEFTRYNPDGNIELQKYISIESLYNRFLRFDKVDNNRFILIFSSQDYSPYTKYPKTTIMFLNENGDILSQRVYNQIEKTNISYAMINEKHGSYYYFASQYDYWEGETGHQGISYMIIDRQGNLLVNGYVEFGENSSGYPYNSVIDSEGNFHIFADFTEYKNGEYSSFYRIFKITLNGEVSHIDNGEMFQESVYYLYGQQDKWDNLIYAQSQYNGNTRTITIRKISVEGKILWETPLADLANSYCRFVSETPSGHILVFLIDRDAASTLYFRLDKYGEILEEKTFPGDFLYSTYKFQDNRIIFADNGMVKIFDPEIAEFIDEMAQGDNRGRTFRVQNIFSNPDGSIYLTGDRKEYTYWLSPASIIRFDSDTLDSNLEQQTKKIQLNGNFPNPFNNQTVIRMWLPESGITEIDVYNTLGQRVDQYSAYMPAGNQVYYFKNSVLSSGTYFYLVRQNGRKATGKFVYVK